MRRFRMAFALAGLLLAIVAQNVNADDSEAPSNLKIVLADSEGEQVFQVQGLSEEALEQLRASEQSDDQWRSFFSVRVAGAAENQPSMLGEYRVDGELLIFEPRFALRAGQTYEARLDIARLPDGTGQPKQQLVERFPIGGAVESPPAEIVAIYPTRDVLPENQLKFYLHFSQPMSRGEAYRHVRLLDENDQEIEFAFLELPQELWDPELKRFTLFFDPGRIKRGLKPREEFGPPIIEGKCYTLVVDDMWLDANGNKLKESRRKEFRVVAPDDVQPDPNRWELSPPAALTKAPLIATFDEPLDHAMLHRVLSMQNASGATISGSIETTDDETIWRFTPDQPWSSGEYHLLIDTRLEDLAGNSIARAFEVDLFEKVEAVTAESAVLPFEIR